MGNTYANLAILGATPEEVRDALASQSAHALITPDLAGTVVAYDEQSDRGDFEWLVHLAASVSARTHAVTMASMNHDDDVLVLEVVQDGRAVVRYANPAASLYGVPVPLGSWFPFAVAWRMSQAFGRTVHAPYAWLVLQRPYLFQVGRHRALAGVLGLPVPGPPGIPLRRAWRARRRGPSGAPARELVPTQSNA